MQALSDDIVRVLAFMNQAERGGGAANRESINAFAAQPAPPDPAWYALSAGMHLHRALGSADVAQWLIDTGLAVDQFYDVVLSPLGEAMLHGAQSSSVTALLLDPDDPLSYPQLVTRLSGDQRTMIADPYIRLSELHQLISETTVTRVLTSSKIGEGERRGMAALASRASRAVEVRLTDEPSWHDRYVLEGERLWLLGASVNGLHKNVTALLPVSDETVAGAVRSYINDLWAGAEDQVAKFETGEPVHAHDEGTAKR
jgi:hypothetical protein